MSKYEKITKSKIKERGWTESMIKKLLGEPDEIKEVKGYRYPLHLYSIKRIKNAERTKRYKELKQKANRKSQKMTEVSEKKRQDLIHYIDNLEIEVPDFGHKEKVLNMACKHYYEHKYYLSLSRNKFDDLFMPNPKTADPEFLTRIVVNMIRHSMDIYEEKLDEIKGEVGKNEAYFRLRDRINDAIYEKYSWLREMVPESSNESNQENKSSATG